MDLPLGPEKLAKMMGMSVQQMEEELKSSWTGVAVSDVMEMRLVGDTRGLGSKPLPGPQYFPRLPNRVAEDDTWRDRGGMVQKPLEVTDAVRQRQGQQQPFI